MKQTDAYWVCAYANNQHNLASDIPADPKASAFFKAMQLCEGVLVVLDKRATPFKRIWCCFEQAMVVQGKKLLLDFATVHNGKAQVLTEGFATPNETAFQKSRREAGFPLKLMEEGYRIRVETAEASAAMFILILH